METRERAWAQVCFAKVLVYGTNQRKRYIQKSSTQDESVSIFARTQIFIGAFVHPLFG